MSDKSSLFPLAACIAVAFAAVAAVTLMPELASARDAVLPGTQFDPPIPAPIPPADRRSSDATCSCPSQPDKSAKRPKFAGMPPAAERAALDESDEIAALESVQFALSEVGDGASYVWHRNNGRLSGLVQPVTSFKASSGLICRHVIVMLTAGTVSKRTEGVACRLSNGQWQLEG